LPKTHIAQVSPFPSVHAIGVDRFAGLAEMFFGVKPVENLNGLRE
jgi:hypothetical protein